MSDAPQNRRRPPQLHRRRALSAAAARLKPQAAYADQAAWPMDGELASDLPFRSPIQGLAGQLRQGALPSGGNFAMAVKIERLAAKTVFDPPTYTQTIKVTGAETILFVSGQVAYGDNGQPAHPGDFAAQARATYSALKAHWRLAGARCPQCRANDIARGHPTPERLSSTGRSTLARRGRPPHSSELPRSLSPDGLLK